MNASLPLKQRQRKPLSMSCFYFWGEPCSNRCAKVLSKYISFESLARGTERKGWTIYLSNITFYETSSHTHTRTHLQTKQVGTHKMMSGCVAKFPMGPNLKFSLHILMHFIFRLPLILPLVKLLECLESCFLDSQQWKWYSHKITQNNLKILFQSLSS